MSEKKYNAWFHFSRADKVMVPDISEDDIGKIGRNLGEKAYWPFVDQYGMQAVISMALVKWVAFEEVDDEETE